MVFFAAVALFFSLVAQIGGGKTLLLLALAIFMGAMLPPRYLNSRALQRQKVIQQTLPDMLDLLLVSVEAGLGFDMSLKRVTEQAPGALSKEINRALEEMRLGKAREEALRSIVRRTGVDDLGSFISAVIQSEQLGSNIANTLRIQAGTMRQKRLLGCKILAPGTGLLITPCRSRKTGSSFSRNGSPLGALALSSSRQATSLKPPQEPLQKPKPNLGTC